ncbi:hypothetical protein [Cystobacter ferrugineus]|uniref:Uncharacterized protein n=1 Tax=Cystobacter ferrugineus TaxID=83449 RepID=A0A1L9BK06_9BACT|nr:hypothetical protein [Cystobacter ferrugineus]OJH42632.1 hypothetical protein BON30_05470 [Cystobacter ferrugineus]
MNFVFISPQFPPHFYLFVQALREQGFRVLLEPHFHAGHITRRHHHRHYQLSREQLLERLGGNLLLHGPTPPAYRGNLGDEMFLVRYTKLADLHQAISWAHTQAR